MKRGTVVIGRKALHVLVANRPWNKMRGMMFRRWEDVGNGMLFPFPFESRWGVEMPFCESMDVVFVSKEMRVVDIQRARPMTLDPRTWKIYRPRKKCKYVLELPAGSGKLFIRGRHVVLNL